MRLHNLSRFMMLAGLLVAAPALAQTTPTTTATTKQKTDGNSPTMVGPASGAYKQHTDGSGAGPTMVGPASGAYKQQTQSLIHSGQSPTSLEKKTTD